MQGQESGFTLREMTTPYIPAAEAAFRDWLINFYTIISTTPAVYGMTVAQTQPLDQPTQIYLAVYAAAENPSTRTTAKIAERVTAREVAESIARELASIARASNPSPAALTNAGLTVNKVPSTPVPPPQTEPDLGLVSGSSLTHKLQYRVPDSIGKAKPYGITGIQIFRALGTLPAIDSAQATYLTTVTKSPFVVGFAAGDRGKIATYYGRYVTRSGPNGQASVGPFSVALVAGVL